MPVIYTRVIEGPNRQPLDVIAESISREVPAAKVRVLDKGSKFLLVATVKTETERDQMDLVIYTAMMFWKRE